MALILEVFGAEALDGTPEEFKDRLRNLPPIWWERKTYLMHEYQNLKSHKWVVKDYEDIGITHNI